jgi:hypothetical protein
MSTRQRITLGRGAGYAPLLFSVPRDTTVRALGDIIAEKLGLQSAPAVGLLAGDSSAAAVDPDELVGDVIRDADIVVALQDPVRTRWW